MNDPVLVINCGSSSIKYALIAADPDAPRLARRLGWPLERIDEVLNRGSGLLGLSGLTHDMRELEAAAEEGHAGAQLAIEV